MELNHDDIELLMRNRSQKRLRGVFPSWLFWVWFLSMLWALVCLDFLYSYYRDSLAVSCFSVVFLAVVLFPVLAFVVKFHQFSDELTRQYMQEEESKRVNGL